MPKLDKATNLYERTEVICGLVKAAGRTYLGQQDTATIGLMTILNEIADSGKSIDELLEQGESEQGKAAKEWRIKVRNLIMPLFTAAKNYQNSYAYPSELMPKTESKDEKEADLGI